jgi:hypothetical protein
LASPALSLEGLLERSEMVFVGRLLTVSKGRPEMVDVGNAGTVSNGKVSFDVVEILRGDTYKAGESLRLVGFLDEPVIRVGETYLVISQGDNHYGQPPSVVSYGQGIKGQSSYCGWLMFPIKEKAGAKVVDLVYSRRRGAGYAGGLPFDEVKALVEENRYKPDLHGKS